MKKIYLLPVAAASLILQGILLAGLTDKINQPVIASDMIQFFHLAYLSNEFAPLLAFFAYKQTESTDSCEAFFDQAYKKCAQKSGSTH